MNCQLRKIEKYVESIGKRFYCFKCDFSERENSHSFLNDLKKNSVVPCAVIGQVIETKEPAQIQVES